MFSSASTAPSALEGSGNSSKRFEDLDLKAKAIIWSRLSSMSHIRSAVDVSRATAAPYSLNSNSYPLPYTLHSIPCNLHHTPYTVFTSSQRFKFMWVSQKISTSQARARPCQGCRPAASMKRSGCVKSHCVQFRLTWVEQKISTMRLRARPCQGWGRRECGCSAPPAPPSPVPMSKVNL